LRGVFSKQNSVIRLKPNIVDTQKFWAGYATEPKYCRHDNLSKNIGAYP